MRLSYSSISTVRDLPRRSTSSSTRIACPPHGSPALSFGDSLHRALHRFHDRPVPVAADARGAPRDARGRVAHRRLPRPWRGAAVPGPRAAGAGRVPPRERAESFRIPAALEFRFTIEVEGVQINGVIDRMDRIPGGGYEIIDYKTNRRLPPQAGSTATSSSPSTSWRRRRSGASSRSASRCTSSCPASG